MFKIKKVVGGLRLRIGERRFRLSWIQVAFIGLFLVMATLYMVEQGSMSEVMRMVLYGVFLSLIITQQLRLWRMEKRIQLLEKSARASKFPVAPKSSRVERYVASLDDRQTRH